MIFPVVMYGCEGWTIERAEYQRIDAFELWGWRRLLRVPWTSRRSNEYILKHTSSVQFSHSVVSDSLWPHRLQHTRPPCPSPTPRVYSNSFPLSHRCHPTISFSVVPFFSCLQSFPASGYFQMSQSFTSGGQSIGVSASVSSLPMNTQNWFPLGSPKGNPLGWTDWISLLSKGLTSVLNIDWKDWCWSWSSNTLATWCGELTHWKRPWCWERLKAGVEGDRGWDGWMTSLTYWTWVWTTSGNWWWVRKRCSPK